MRYGPVLYVYIIGLSYTNIKVKKRSHMEIKRFFSVVEDLDGNTMAECCPQCGSVGVVHFEDSTTSDSQQHSCLKCSWTWDGCTFSDGKTKAERLNSILSN